MKCFCVSVSLLVLVGLAGCNGNESKKGGPGATSDTRTFTLTVPGETTVARGKREEVVLSIDRGKDFTQTVKLEFKKPAGIEVIPPDPMIKSGESQVKVFIGAAADAKVGVEKIEVTGKPETGKSVSVPMKVEVN